VIGVAVLLGLRHASDPDHLAAVTTLIATGKERTKRAAAALGFSWGLGHATSLFAFGLPIVLFKAYLPERVQQAAETTIGLVIVALAVWLLVRWRRGVFHAHLHAHGDQGRHVHVHTHTPAAQAHPHASPARARSPLQAYGIGLIHGLGGSAGVGVLLLASIHNRLVAVAALALFAFFTAVSMALLSTGFGLTLSSPRIRRSFNTIAPALGVFSLCFGVWYALGALDVAPYVF
jgi:ABC-type nickel/cobalt efflux system permease component RcnA